MKNIQIYQKIAQNNPTPVLPCGLDHLLQAFDSDFISQTQLAKIIADFPSITARLLFLANSAWVSPRIPVENLETACLKLGTELVRSISIAICVESSFAGVNKCKEFKTDYFWCTSLLTSQAAKLLASKALKPAEFNTATLQTAGLLHNLGLLWLADNYPEQTSEALRRAAEDESLSILQALRTVLDSDYCEIGGMLGRSWNLPGTLISAMEQHCSELYPYPDYSSTVLVGYAVKLISALQHGKPERPEILLQASVNLEPTDLDNIYGILQDKFFEIQELARSVFSV